LACNKPGQSTVVECIAMGGHAISRTQVEQRLQALQAEWASGQKMLADLEAQRTHLTNTLLRISGAMQVLEELLAQAPEAVPPPVVRGNAIANRTDTDVRGDNPGDTGSGAQAYDAAVDPTG